MYILAYVCLLMALLCSIGSGGMALIQLWQGRSDALRILGKFRHVVAGCLLLASALLLHGLFWEDYRLEYVASYTDSYLPIFYRLTAFWAGQPGSMLFWALAVAMCGCIFGFMPLYSRQGKATLLWFWAFFYANMAFFCLVLTCWSNPFIMQIPAPVDGNGLNPLLQNPGMIFHPPLLFLGYAGFTVPACLGLAQAMAKADDNPSWFLATRPFIMGAWIFLTAGIVLGAWWAYMELGWGGYWAWDPVENASLLPWLSATACIHILVAQRREGKLARSSAALMALTIILAFFATYLTRSGVIQSVHAFGDGGVGTPLLLFVMGASIIAFLAAFSGKSAGRLSSPFSREGALVLVAWILLAITAIITLATIWPVLSAMWGNPSRGLDASFYNRVCLPPAALLLALLAICPWLGWNGGLAARGATAGFYATCGAFLASAAAIWIAGYRLPLPLMGASCAIAALCAASMRIVNSGQWGNGRAISALGAHAGLAILALGIAFSGPYTTEKELMLARGQQATVGPYTVALEKISDGSGRGYDFLRADLKISMDGKKIGELLPERRMYAKFGQMQFSEVDVISTLGQDIYASLLGMDEDYRVLVKISIEPLVNWIWAGGFIMCLVPAIGLLIAGRRKNAS